MCLNLKSLTVKDILPLAPLRILSCTSDVLMPLLLFWSSLESSFLSVFTKCSKNCSECHSWVPSSGTAAREDVMLCVLTHLIHWIWYQDFWFFCKIGLIMRRKCFEPIQDVEAARTVQVKTLTKELFQSELLQKVVRTMDKCVCRKGRILRKINVSDLLLEYF